MGSPTWAITRVLGFLADWRLYERSWTQILASFLSSLRFHVLVNSVRSRSMCSLDAVCPPHSWPKSASVWSLRVKCDVLVDYCARFVERMHRIQLLCYFRSSHTDRWGNVAIGKTWWKHCFCKLWNVGKTLEHRGVRLANRMEITLRCFWRLKWGNWRNEGDNQDKILFFEIKIKII
jgi:hypothetical protein